MPGYALRVRFHSDGSTIASNEKTLDIPVPSIGGNAQLKALNADTLDKADKFSIQIRGFNDRTAAEAYGRRVKTAVRICGIKLRTGLDAGNDTSKGGITEAGKGWARQMFGLPEGVPLHNDVHGMLVYEGTELEPRFVGVGGKATVGRNKDSFVAALQEGLALAERLTESQSLAAEMYNLSHFEGSNRARFVTLITAVECISQPHDLPSDVGAVVDELLLSAQQHSAITVLAKTNPSLRDSLLGRLQGLRKESIGKACERVLKTRLGEESRVQFKRWYDLRSKMVHTGTVPAGTDLGRDISLLDEMISKLLLADIEALA